MYGMADGGDYADRYKNVYNSSYDLEATGNSAYFYMEKFFSEFTTSVMGGLTEFFKNITSVAGSLNVVNNFKLNGSPNWPKNNWFAGNVDEIILQPGTQIDRYGLMKGGYVSPTGTPYSMRALDP